jgi:hypothetical protein
VIATTTEEADVVKVLEAILISYIPTIWPYGFNRVKPRIGLADASVSLLAEHICEVNNWEPISPKFTTVRMVSS